MSSEVPAGLLAAEWLAVPASGSYGCDHRPMRVAALYDVHGNAPALEAVLDELDRCGAELVVVGGDVASGPMPAQTLDLLLQLRERVRFVRGNADRELIDAYESWAAGALHSGGTSPALEPMAAWAAQRLTAAHRDLLASFAPNVRLSVEAAGEVLFCHATPRSDEEIITAATTDERLADALADEPPALIVAGHTHVQLDRTVAGRRFVNAGSVGMPYEDEPGAYWALLGPEVSLRRTHYDYERAAAVIRASGYPDAQDMIRDCLSAGVGAAQATRIFESFAAKRDAPFRGG